MSNKLKVVSEGYVQHYDDLGMLGKDLSLAGLVTPTSSPTVVNTVSDEERERIRRLAQPVR